MNTNINLSDIMFAAVMLAITFGNYYVKRKERREKTDHEIRESYVKDVDRTKQKLIEAEADLEEARTATATMREKVYEMTLEREALKVSLKEKNQEIHRLQEQCQKLMNDKEMLEQFIKEMNDQRPPGKKK